MWITHKFVDGNTARKEVTEKGVLNPCDIRLQKWVGLKR